MTQGPSYPPVRLGDLPGGADCLVLCANARLATAVRHAHGQAQLARGYTRWQALNGATPAQWLDHQCSAALLRGELDPASMPAHFLVHAQEVALWQAVIAADGELDEALFDREGLALCAMEAAALARTWSIALTAWPGREGAALLRWQRQVAQRCAALGALPADAALDKRIDWLERGIGALPAQVVLAGFRRIEPPLARLLRVLRGRGVALYTADLAHPGAQPGLAQLQVCADLDAECAAAARWASDMLAANPQAQLTIALADPAAQTALEHALEAALCAPRAAQLYAPAEAPFARCDGPPLSDAPLVVVALDLLHLALNPRHVDHAAFGRLLRRMGWSADCSEADARALCEARLRELLPAECTLMALLAQVQRLHGQSVLATHLEQLLAQPRQWPRRQSAAQWGACFRSLLAALGWPGERQADAGEAQSIAGLVAALSDLARLDLVLGKIDAAQALQRLRQACREHRMQAPRQTPARILVGSLAQMTWLPCDGLWLMGMHAAVWPPPAQPNALIPAALQRRAGVPAACVELLREDARWLVAQAGGCAPAVVFSYAAQAGDTPQRASTLLAGLPPRASPPAAAAPPAAREANSLEWLDDAQAPPLAAGERIPGGSALLQAQAVCPAWAFYRYRLGGAVLPKVSFGLDARTHGRMLHAALEIFWQERDSSVLAVGDGEAGNVPAVPGSATAPTVDPPTHHAAPLAVGSLSAEITRVVAAGMARVLAERARSGVPSPGRRLLALEATLLERLVGQWLAHERLRPAFRVLACERKLDLQLAGLDIRLVIDRIDEQADGRWIIIDYKSAAQLSCSSWAAPRVREPQLPTYAALALPGADIAAVAMAQINPAGSRFVGVADADDSLPGLVVLGSATRAAQAFSAAGMSSLAQARAHWQASIGALAGEIVAGEAAVVFARVDDLRHCDVLPLLRLPEWRAQRQRWLADPARAAGASATAAGAADGDPTADEASGDGADPGAVWFFGDAQDSASLDEDAA